MYQDYDSDSDVPEELKQDFVDEQTGDVPLKRSVRVQPFYKMQKTHGYRVCPGVPHPCTSLFYKNIT